MCRTDELATFLCRLSRNSGSLKLVKPTGLFRPVLEYFYLPPCYISKAICVCSGTRLLDGVMSKNKYRCVFRAFLEERNTGNVSEIFVILCNRQAEDTTQML